MKQGVRNQTFDQRHTWEITILMEFASQLQHYRGLPLTWRKLHNIYLSLTKLEVLTVRYRYFVFSLMTHKSKMKRTRIRNLQKRPSRLGQQDTYVYCVSGGCWKRILITWNKWGQERSSFFSNLFFSICKKGGLFFNLRLYTHSC